MGPALLAGAALVCLALSVLLRRSSAARPDRAGPARPAAAARTVAAETAGPRSGLVGFLAGHRWARRTLAVAAGLMVVGAGVAAAYPFLTDQYTEHLQTRLAKQLSSPQTRVAYRTHSVPVGHSLTRIRIPKIGVDTVVVEGTTQSALRAGAGHYVDSPLPCDRGNVAIAGHRVTFGKPFTDLEKLSVGDVVYLDTPVGSCTYRITT